MTVKQAEHYLNNELRLILAKEFVNGAFRNIRQVVSYYNNRGKEIAKILAEIEALGEKIDTAYSIEELMAIEGNIRDTYYKGFDEIIDDPEFKFESRSKRPPQNKLNALISFGNSLMYTTILSEIYRTHLDPRIGFLHTSNFRRFSLNLDVAEIFKPIIVDRLIFALINKKIIKVKDFDSKLGGIVLTEEGNKLFIREFEEKMASTIKHNELGRNVSYRRIIRMELYKIEKHLLGEKQYTPFIARW
jgi:CRISPR-associated protein Cas1